MAWGNPVASAEEVDISKLPQTDPRWIAERDRLLMTWENSKSVLAAAKESEMADRLAFSNFAFPIEGRKSGVNKLELGNGYVAKLGHKVNFKIVAANKAVEDAEELAPTLGNEAVFLFERIITWTPNFSVGEYNKLLPNDSEEHRKVKELIDTLIETSNGTPSLEIVEPKATLNG